MSSLHDADQTFGERLREDSAGRRSLRPWLVVTWGLGGVIVALLGLHLLTQWLADRAPLEDVVRYDLATYRLRYRMFHLDREMNIPTWFSSLLIAGNAALMLVIAWCRWQRRERDVWPWVLLGLVFIYLSADESVAIHDTLPGRVRGLMGDHATGLLYFAWYVPALALACGMGAVLLPFWWRLRRGTRYGCAAAMAVYVMGAVGFEAVTGMILEPTGLIEASAQHPSATLITLVMLEEGCEMLGMAILAVVLMHDLHPQISIRALTEPERVDR